MRKVKRRDGQHKEGETACLEFDQGFGVGYQQHSNGHIICFWFEEPVTETHNLAWHGHDFGGLCFEAGDELCEGTPEPTPGVSTPRPDPEGAPIFVADHYTTTLELYSPAETLVFGDIRVVDPNLQRGQTLTLSLAAVSDDGGLVENGYISATLDGGDGYEYAGNGCCRGPAATTWNMRQDPSTLEECFLICHDDPNCNAVEINGCGAESATTDRCSARCYNFYGNAAGPMVVNRCVTNGDQKCFRRANVRVTLRDEIYDAGVAQGQTITLRVTATDAEHRTAAATLTINVVDTSNTPRECPFARLMERVCDGCFKACFELPIAIFFVVPCGCCYGRWCLHHVFPSLCADSVV